MPENQKESSQLPFSLFLPKEKQTPLAKAFISFKPDQSASIHLGQFFFQDGSLEYQKQEFRVENASFSKGNVQSVPYYSITALVLFIFVRNLYYSAFRKYLISLVNNYEIDFSFQKIGIFPILFAQTITFLAFFDLLNSFSPDWFVHDTQILEKVKISGQILFYPFLSSIILLLFLNFSARFFPVIFSDIKTLFFLSLVVLIWNFLSFGMPQISSIPAVLFLLVLTWLYFILRSFLFFNVFRKAYRFRMPITVFYICILNLGTFLLLYQGLRSIF